VKGRGAVVAPKVKGKSKKAKVRNENHKFQAPNYKQAPSNNDPMTKIKKTLIARALPGVGNADLRSLQKKFSNAFV
jgi:hypothetical protein